MDKSRTVEKNEFWKSNSSCLKRDEVDGSIRPSFLLLSSDYVFAC